MKMNDLDDLHHFVNDLYERWDEGEISYELARDKARVYCGKWAFKITRMYLDEYKYKINHKTGAPIFYLRKDKEVSDE